jgi:hypothetical protein
VWLNFVKVFGMSEHSDGSGRPKPTRSVSERFQKAKEEQRIREDERRASIRIGENRDIWKTRGSISGKWEEVLHESKVDEQRKFAQQKRNTIATFLSAYEDGLVRRRIDHYEALFMQFAASLEKIQATIRASRSKNINRGNVDRVSSSDKNQNIRKESDGQIIIDFPLGATQTYNFDAHSALRALLLNCLIANLREPIPLLCGIYGENDVKPSIEVVAVAMLDDGAQTQPDEPYIAITIDNLPGHEQDDSVFGMKKVALFVSSGQENEDKTLIWDACFNLMPRISVIEEEVQRGEGITSPASPPPPSDSILSDVDSIPPVLVSVSDDGRGGGGQLGGSESRDEICSEIYPPVSEAMGSSVLDVLSQDGTVDRMIHGQGEGSYVSDSDSIEDEGAGTWKDVNPEAGAGTIKPTCHRLHSRSCSLNSSY